MSDVKSHFIPVEWVGDRYHPIGGNYETFELALSALERHFNNKHGGGGVFRVFRPDETHGSAAVIEASPTPNDPYLAKALYKVIVGH